MRPKSWQEFFARCRAVWSAVRVRWEFVPADAWVGVFPRWRLESVESEQWKRGFVPAGVVTFVRPVGAVVVHERDRFDLWLCLMPCFPLHVWWRGPGADAGADVELDLPAAGEGAAGRRAGGAAGRAADGAADDDARAGELSCETEVGPRAMSHVLATIVFLGGLAGSAWLAWRGRPADGVVVLVVTVLAVCVIGSFGGREEN